MLEGYRRTSAVGRDYIDTGILAQSNLEIEAVISCIFGAEDKDAGAMFGARNTNSNTSAGQLNVYQYASGYYFGYNNGRATITMPSQSFGDDSTCKFVINNNSISINQQCAITKTGTRTATVFTGNKNIYVGAVNNGGNADISPFFVESFKLSQNGTVLKDYVACERISDGVFGLYDQVSDTFDSGNGTFISTGDLIQLGNHDNGKVTGEFGYLRTTTLTAFADEGYAFAGWNVNGQFYSMENPLKFTPTVVRTYTVDAIFVKKFQDDFNLPWKLFAQSRYNIGIGYNSIYEMHIVEATINEDGLEKSTSTFIVESVPSAVKVGHMVIMYTPRGRKYYQGIIESIDGTTLVCREALAYFDAPYLFHNNTNNAVLVGNTLTNMTQLNLQFVLHRYIRSLQYGINNTDNMESALTNERYNFIGSDGSPMRDNFLEVNFPLIKEAEIQNFEEFLFGMFDSFGVLVNVDFILRRPQMTVSADYDTTVLTISDNVDAITDLSVEIEYTDTNLVFVYNDAGTTFRGLLTYPNVDTNTAQGTIPAMQTMVMSDDSMDTIEAQYISDGNYNHKISFIVRYPNDIINIDEMKVGQRIKFYRGGNLYDSIITGRSYTISTSEEIREVRYTLGKARTSLTSKINLGKV